jgi:hypothetical protein
MITNKHNNTTFLGTLAAGFLLATFATSASAKEDTNWPGGGPTIGDNFDVTGDTGPRPGVDLPGQQGPSGLPPLGYIDIPEIDRGPEDGSGDGNAESNAPGLPGTNGITPLDIFGPSVPFNGTFNEFDFLMGVGQVSGPEQASGIDYADLLYTEAPDIELSLDNKPIMPGVTDAGGVSAVPTPGAVGLGLIAGASMVHRRRR